MILLLSLLTLVSTISVPKQIFDVYDVIVPTQFSFTDNDFVSNADVTFKITNYGDTILQNKLAITNQMLQMQISGQDQALIMAMAMQETVSLSSNDRDQSKDGTSSENISQWNINIGLIETVSPDIDPRSLNYDIGACITFILKALNQYGLEGYLDLIRGVGFQYYL